MTTPWSYRYAQRTQRLTSSAIRELLKYTQRPEMISFAGGLPAPEIFPSKQIAEACQRVLEEMSAVALQYSTTEGYPPLREMIARHIARYGIVATPDNVVITSGSQQALDLIGKLLINPGDRLLVEAPTYLGALQAFNVYGADYVSVPVDEDGIQTDQLDESLRAGPKFIYLLPNFQNPSGVTLSLARRKMLVALADKYGTPIVEDDPYGQLRFEGDHLPSLLVLDRETQGIRGDNGYQLGNVIYLSTLSKTLAPGLRLGWIVAPPDVIAKLVQLKQGADLHTSTFTQMVAYETARGGFLDEHVRLIRQVYRERRDTMLQALGEYVPRAWGVTWTHPAGGLFLWLRLPPGGDSAELLKEALKENVAFVPGEAFFAPGGAGDDPKRYARLNFSNAKPEMIREGIRRLAAAMRAYAPTEYTGVEVNADLAQIIDPTLLPEATSE
ncbi:MAG TPA: PLP-dependent aminotransferase family protein [Anaerolineales bacterium]|nr:PLP-dependent aminotransferase family protein [Anaerolineales bacterium]